MHNEVLVFASALFDIVCVFVASRFGSRWLYVTIAINLMLVSIFGGELIQVFNWTTNVGNVFYACVFFATHCLIEKKDGKSYTAKFFGLGVIVVFTVLSQITIHLKPLNPTDSVVTSLQTIFKLSPHIAFASMVAYLFAQWVNVTLYTRIKTATSGGILWLRSNVSMIMSQLIDSTFFFTIAFLTVSGTTLFQAIISGWVIKSLVGLLSTPFLYFDRYLDTRESHEA